MSDYEHNTLVVLAIICQGRDLEKATYGQMALAMREKLRKMGAKIVKTSMETD